MSKNLEFIQITRSFEFTPDSSSLDFLSGEAERKALGQGGRPKRLGGVATATLRTFLADNAGIGLCSRP